MNPQILENLMENFSVSICLHLFSFILYMNALVFFHSMGMVPSHIDKRQWLFTFGNNKVFLRQGCLIINNKKTVLLKWDIPVIVNESEFDKLLILH